MGAPDSSQSGAPLPVFFNHHTKQKANRMAITAALDIAGYQAKPYIGKDMETTVPYIVRTDSESQIEVDIMAADVLPDRGDVHPENAYLAAYECTLRRNDKLQIGRAHV